MVLLIFILYVLHITDINGDQCVRRFIQQMDIKCFEPIGLQYSPNVNDELGLIYAGYRGAADIEYRKKICRKSPFDTIVPCMHATKEAFIQDTSWGCSGQDEAEVATAMYDIQERLGQLCMRTCLRSKSPEVSECREYYIHLTVMPRFQGNLYLCFSEEYLEADDLHRLVGSNGTYFPQSGGDYFTEDNIMLDVWTSDVVCGFLDSSVLPCTDMIRKSYIARYGLSDLSKFSGYDFQTDWHALVSELCNNDTCFSMRTEELDMCVTESHIDTQVWFENHAIKMANWIKLPKEEVDKFCSTREQLSRCLTPLQDRYNTCPQMKREWNRFYTFINTNELEGLSDDMISFCSNHVFGGYGKNQWIHALMIDYRDLGLEEDYQDHHNGDYIDT